MGGVILTRKKGASPAKGSLSPCRGQDKHVAYPDGTTAPAGVEHQLKRFAICAETWLLNRLLEVFQKNTGRGAMLSCA